MTEMTFEDFLIRCLQEYNRSGAFLRVGQVYVNVLSTVKPALMRNIVVDYPNFDPYYNNDNLPRFLLHVYRCWNESWTNLSNQEYEQKYRSLAEGTNQVNSRRWLDG